ncbi:MAG: TetR family transcriptional regulator [Gammaproteobacteria bacterium]|nr:MAG: TetR family transcriptional regulator [Gammaproteobacteria bacterium]
MSKPRFSRRKEDRPAEITAAAIEVFAEKGYDGTRVDDVARRAGISKGLLYLYFKTKEELFKAVIKSFIAPKINALKSEVESSDLSAEAFLRGPFLDFAKQIPKSPVKVLVRLMVAEGPKHPDLTAYYWDNVVSQGLAALGQIIEKGVRDGEFRHSALDEYPQLLLSPVMFSVIWLIVFQSTQVLDTDKLLDAHIDMVLSAIKLDNDKAGAP